MPHYDLVIIGAGPAGAAAAVTGRRAGLSVALIDKARFPRQKLCGGLVTGRCAGHMTEVFGLSPAAPLFETRRHFEFFLHGRPLGAVADVPPLYLTMRWDLDERLFRTALAAGAADFSGHRIAALEPGQNRLRLRSGPVLNYGVLIGADGVQSPVARTLFGRAFDPRRIGFALETEAPAAGATEASPIRIDFAAAGWGYGWVFPKSGSTTIGLGGLQARNPNMKGRLAGYLDALGTGQDTPVKGHFLPLGDDKPRPGRGNILLAGDAAGFVDPITGEGIGHAIDSGRHAALAAARALGAGEAQRALALYRPAITPIRTALRCARFLRPLIFAQPLQGFFGATFARSRSLKRDYMHLLAGETEYPRIMARVAARLPRAVLRASASGLRARRP